MNRRQMLSCAAKAAGLGIAMNCLPVEKGAGEEPKTKSPAPFQYALCNELFGTWPLEKAFAFTAECGYKGVEIAPFTIAQYATNISAARRTEVRRIAEKAGLEIVGLHWLLAKTEGFHLTAADAAVRRKTADYLGALAAFCADLGGKILVFGSPQQRNLAAGMSKDDGMKHAVEVLRAAMPACEKADVTLAFEPLSTKDTNFITTAAEGAALVERVDSPRCRLHLDCKAMATEPTPIPELIRKFHKVTIHFHANDANLQGPGFGRLDFVPILRALKEVEYRGWVSVEPLDYSPGVERTARESIRYLERCAKEA
jgi:sugar phosphate isomerase/epimerase